MLFAFIPLCFPLASTLLCVTQTGILLLSVCLCVCVCVCVGVCVYESVCVCEDVLSHWLMAVRY